MRIYVAGKYSNKNPIEFLNNIQHGIKVCANILKNGDEPFCPFLDYQFQFFQDLKIEDYYRYSLAWLEVSEQIWVLPDSGYSVGTQMEINRANELGIPVRYL